MLKLFLFFYSVMLEAKLSRSHLRIQTQKKAQRGRMWAWFKVRLYIFFQVVASQVAEMTFNYRQTKTTAATTLIREVVKNL